MFKALTSTIIGWHPSVVWAEMWSGWFLTLETRSPEIGWWLAGLEDVEEFGVRTFG
ncbi:MAG: hypothetical protein ACE5OW_00615 [Candidatus Bathyarchaeia archaeon]